MRQYKKYLLIQNQKIYFCDYSIIYEYEVTQNVFVIHNETHKGNQLLKNIMLFVKHTIMLFVKHTIKWKSYGLTSLITFFS